MDNIHRTPTLAGMWLPNTLIFHALSRKATVCGALCSVLTAHWWYLLPCTAFLCQPVRLFLFLQYHQPACHVQGCMTCIPVELYRSFHITSDCLNWKHTHTWTAFFLGLQCYSMRPTGDSRWRCCGLWMQAVCFCGSYLSAMWTMQVAPESLKSQRLLPNFLHI